MVWYHRVNINNAITLYAVFSWGMLWEEVGGFWLCLMLKLLHVEFKLFNKSLMFQFESDQWG